MLPFTLQQLEILRTIAIEQSFTKTANVLYLSQPTITKHIRKLEKNIGLLLINRERKQISLTQDAKVFLEYSNRILDLSSKSCELVIGLRNGNIDGLRNIDDLKDGTNLIIDTYLMPHRLAFFTLQQLEILRTIAIEQSFTKAAKVLCLSQPAVTKHIQKLEKNSGLLLIKRERERKPISLTQEGRIFLEYSNQILELSNRSCEIVVSLKKHDIIDLIGYGIEHLIVGINPIIDKYLMPHILAFFTQKYPTIELNVQVNSTRIIEKEIITQKMDIAMVSDKISNDLKDDLTIELFVYDKLNLVISKYYKFPKNKTINKENLYSLDFLALNSNSARQKFIDNARQKSIDNTLSENKNKTINKEDLYSLDFITLNSNSARQKFIDNILSENKIETKQLKTILQLNSIEAIKKAVSLGLGAAFLPSSAIEKEINFKTIEIIEIKNIKMERKFFLISSLDGYKSKAFKLFHNELTRLKTRAEN